MATTQSTDPQGQNYVASTSVNPTGGSQAASALGWYQSANGTIVSNKSGDTTENVGYNPVTTANTPASSGFNSSAQVGVNNNTTTSMTNATNGIINGGQQQSPYSQNGQNGFNNSAAGTIESMQSAALGAYSSGINAGNIQMQMALQNSNLAMQSVAINKDTGLASLSQQYNQAFQTIQTQHMNTIGAAVSQMSAADPMGVQNSSFASGYIGKVNDMYTQQADFLTQAYGQQQVALQNGVTQAAISIQQQINGAQASFYQNIAQLNTTLAQSMSQIAQFGTQQSNFEQQRQLQSQSNFESSLKSTNLTGVDPNASTDTLQQQFPNLFTEGQQAGFSADQIAQSIQTGTLATKNTQIAQQNMYTNIFKAQSEFGAMGSGSGSSTANLSPFGQSIVSGGGTAALANHPDISTTFSNLVSAASPQNLTNLMNFVNDGNTNKLTTVLGGMMNNFFGANIADITSSKAVGEALQEQLGIQFDSSSLANVDPATRSKVISSILNSVQGKLEQKSTLYSKTYNLGNLAGQLDTADQNLSAAIKQLGGTSGSSSSNGSAGGLTSLYSGLNGMNWGNAFSGLGGIFGQ